MSDVAKTYPNNLLYIILQKADEIPSDEKMITVEINFRNVLSSLPKLEQTMIKLRFEEEKSYHDVGRTTGFSEEYVKNIIKKSIYDLQTNRIVEILYGAKRPYK